jgi:hypothetical protein
MRARRDFGDDPARPRREGSQTLYKVVPQAFTMVAEREGMIYKRHLGAGLVATGVLLTALTAGCGGSSTKATPLVTPTTVGVPTNPAKSTTTAKTAPKGPGATTGATPAGGSTAAQLSVAKQELEQAGVSLAGSDSAISGSDVNQAKLQAGSAP